MLARDQGRGEIAAQRFRNGLHVECPADRIEAAGRTDDAATASLHVPHPHLIAHVAGFPRVVPLRLGHAHVPAGSDAHRRIREGRDQGLERTSVDSYRGISLDHELPPEIDRKSTRLNSSHPSISYAV